MRSASNSSTPEPSGAAATSSWASAGVARSGWRAPGRRSARRVVLGVLLVAGCVGGSVLLWAHAGDRRPVLALTHPVEVGHVLGTRDVRAVEVAVDPEVPTIDAEDAGTVLGRPMSTSLPTGSLLTPGAIAPAALPGPGRAVVALAVTPGHVPVETAPGAHVAVVAITSPSGPATNTPGAEAPGGGGVWDAVVTSVAAPASDQSVVLSVQLAQDDARAVAALPTGQLAIVLLPVGAR